MSTGTAPHSEGFEVVVGIDGVLTVPTDELARHGVRPGAHLRVVQESPPSAARRSARGALAGVIDAESLDALESALDGSKAERIAAVERRWAWTCCPSAPTRRGTVTAVGGARCDARLYLLPLHAFHAKP